MTQIEEQEVGEQSESIEKQPYGDFILKKNTVTDEAYFEVPASNNGIVIHNGELILESRTSKATGERILSLPRVSSDIQQQKVVGRGSIFSKYIRQHDKYIEYSLSEMPNLYGTESVHLTDFWNQVQKGNIVDARVIAGVFKYLISDIDNTTYEEVEELRDRYESKISNVLKHNYEVESSSEVKGEKIDEDPWMTTSQNRWGDHYYNNSKPEVLVIASEDKIYLDDGRLNLNARIQVNMEMMPAQLGVGITFPGGSQETFESDKPFTDRSTGEVDTRLKADIHNILNYFGNDKRVASGVMEVVQETELGLPDVSVSGFYRLKSVLAGPDTTNAISNLVVIDSVQKDNDYGRTSADEVVAISNDTYTIMELLTLTKIGVITDTRFVAMLGQLSCTKPERLQPQFIEA